MCQIFNEISNVHNVELYVLPRRVERPRPDGYIVEFSFAESILNSFVLITMKNFSIL